MNELEKYKNSLNPTEGNYHSNPELLFRGICNRGFDAAIALDLPVKFAKWKERTDKITPHRFPTYKAYYQYWLDNVLKLE